MDHSYSHASASVNTTLQALCRQEETHYQVTADYLAHLPATSTTDASEAVQKVAQRRAKCRAAMVTWCCTVVDYLEFERETVSMALNCLDRFMETPAGRACLTTPRQYKIAGMTCLYTCIKAHEPEAIEPELVVELSGHLCQPEDVEAMERTLLASLKWSVNPPTALAFCRSLLALVPATGVVSAEECASLLELAQVQTELAVAEPRLVTTPPSLLALASIFNALESKHSSMEILDDLSQLFFMAMAGSAHLKNMDAVFDVQDVLDDIIRQHNDKQQAQAEEEQEEEAAAPATVEEEEEEEQEQVHVVEQEEDEEDVEEDPLDDDEVNPAADSPSMGKGRPNSRSQQQPVQVTPSALRYKAAEAA